MARARNIKPGFYKNEELAECSVWARLIFPGLWMLADREGRLEDRPKRIKGELLPFDSHDVEPLLRELEANGFLERYQIDGQRFIQISKFSAHQTPHYSEKQSVIKGPALQENPPHIHPPISEKQVPINGTGLQEHSEKRSAIKRGSQPPDSLNPDLLIPDSPNPDCPKPESGEKKKKARSAAAPPTLVVFKTLSDEIGEELASQWLAYRKRKRADLTPAAWVGIKAEASKANLTPAEAVAVAMARGWQSFVAAHFVENGHHGSPRGKQAELEARNAAAAEDWLRRSRDAAA